MFKITEYPKSVIIFKLFNVGMIHTLMIWFRKAKFSQKSYPNRLMTFCGGLVVLIKSNI